MRQGAAECRLQVRARDLVLALLQLAQLREKLCVQALILDPVAPLSLDAPAATAQPGEPLESLGVVQRRLGAKFQQRLLGLSERDVDRSLCTGLCDLGVSLHAIARGASVATERPVDCNRR